MDLNIYTERKNNFDIKKFKEKVTLFLLRNQIKSAHSSEYLHSCLLTLKTLVQENILDKEEDSLQEGQKTLFEHIDKFEKSELFENLPDNEKSVFSCLLSFTKQYIEAIKDNKTYVHDQMIHLETILLKFDVQEMFNFSKHYFALSIKNKKVTFDKIVDKEINNFEKKYGFKDIFFRKSLDMRDKIILLKNLDTLGKVLDEISNDFNLEPTALSLNGMISISFEPNILGYSSAAAYMNRFQETYVICLGKYDNIKELKNSYFHEFAHCLDYTNYKKEERITYSEQALNNIKNQEPISAIEKVMHNELGFNDYHKETKVIYKNMLDDIFSVLKKEFKVETDVDFYSIKNLAEDIKYIVDNYYKLDTYALSKSFLIQALVNKGSVAEAICIRNNLEFIDIENNKSKSLENKIAEVRNKYYYVLGKNNSFFLSENKKELLLTDLRESKVYYTKVVEIFARAFESCYKEEKSLYYTLIENEEKENYKKLIKEVIEDILVNNKKTLTRKLT